MLFLMGTALCILTRFSDAAAEVFGSPDNVLDYAGTYTRITSIGFPFIIMSNGCGHLIRADGSQIRHDLQSVGR